MQQHSKDRHSRFLSLVLRHQPQKIGLSLDEAGWVPVNVLLDQMASAGRCLSRAELAEIVRDNNKQRFAFSEDGLRIRANQGHSIKVQLGYTVITPPDELFHGTATRNIASIQCQGLLRGQRHHVHLTDNRDTAIAVGTRYGEPVVLIVAAAKMVNEGHSFYRSQNGVWLTEHVPPQYINELEH